MLEDFFLFTEILLILLKMLKAILIWYSCSLEVFDSVSCSWRLTAIQAREIDDHIRPLVPCIFGGGETQCNAETKCEGKVFDKMPEPFLVL